jgi:hypothetical protein
MNSSSKLALLSCPFCGGEAVFEHVDAKGTDEHRWSVGCSAMPDNFMPGRDVLCHGNQSFNTYPRKIDAAKAWNTRPETSSPQAPIAKLTIRESGAGHYAPDIVTATLYAPGLPPGEYDLYCEPEASGQYIRQLKAGERT